MRIQIVTLILIASIASGRADQTIESAQQTLKDQGFYYGEITGEKDADTIAAIRRYQIRNGLQITGELNEETLRSLRSTPARPSEPVAKPAPAPAPNPDLSDLRDDSRREGERVSPPSQSFSQIPQDRQPVQPDAGAAVRPTGGLFAGTPYEAAPPDVQRKVIADAQKILTRLDLFRSPIDGMFGADLEFSLRAYQSRVRLPTTGRLDLDTLAALKLLPGADAPIYRPRRGLRPRPYPQPPVRGEWIRP